MEVAFEMKERKQRKSKDKPQPIVSGNTEVLFDDLLFPSKQRVIRMRNFHALKGIEIDQYLDDGGYNSEEFL
jgi:hypothetical protein